MRGSAIAASGPVSLSAGGNVAIEAARESRQEYHLNEEKYSRKLPKFGTAAQAEIHFVFGRHMESRFCGDDRGGFLRS